MKEIIKFQIFCPKVEGLTPKGRYYWIDPAFLANGGQAIYHCTYSQASDSSQSLGRQRFGLISLEVSLLDEKELITLKGDVNQERGVIEATFDCRHCGHHINMTFPWTKTAS